MTLGEFSLQLDHLVEQTVFEYGEAAKITICKILHLKISSLYDSLQGTVVDSDPQKLEKLNTDKKEFLL